MLFRHSLASRSYFSIGWLRKAVQTSCWNVYDVIIYDSLRARRFVGMERYESLFFGIAAVGREWRRRGRRFAIACRIYRMKMGTVELGIVQEAKDRVTVRLWAERGAIVTYALRIDYNKLRPQGSLGKDASREFARLVYNQEDSRSPNSPP